jgi:HD-GYP domain-containing protein (c-di-GMP phosphodiesterase class II)
LDNKLGRAAIRALRLTAHAAGEGRLVNSSSKQKSSADAVPDASALLPIVIETLRHSDGFDFDLYLVPKDSRKPVLYRKRSFPLLESDLDMLSANGIHTLYIPANSLEAYQDYLRNGLLGDKAASPRARLCALHVVNRAVFLNALSGGATEQVVQVANTLGNELADLVEAHEDMAQDLFAMLNHDYCTFTHVINVSVYSLMLGKHLQISSSADLSAIATGALLHDIGKRKIARAILNKQGRLTNDETNVMRLHPQTGFMELAHRQDFQWSQLMMVYQHHERIDGQGYPVQVSGEEIDPWARICAIGDVFDAMTSCRAYHHSRSTEEVLQFLDHNSDKIFDRDMVQCWNKSVMSMT